MKEKASYKRLGFLALITLLWLGLTGCARISTPTATPTQMAVRTMFMVVVKPKQGDERVFHIYSNGKALFERPAENVSSLFVVDPSFFSAVQSIVLKPETRNLLGEYVAPTDASMVYTMTFQFADDTTKTITVDDASSKPEDLDVLLALTNSLLFIVKAMP